MKRAYKLPSNITKNQWFARIFTFSVLLFAIYKILTPNQTVVEKVTSPDGQITARLRKIYYVQQPSYKIDYHTQEYRLWLNLLYLSQYTNVPSKTACETLSWDSDTQLNFKINGTSIWTHAFEK